MARKKSGDMITFRISDFKKYKRQYGTVPRCISCGWNILVGDKAEIRVGAHQTKYLCEECSKKDVVVYQYPRPLKVANKEYGLDKLRDKEWGWRNE